MQPELLQLDLRVRTPQGVGRIMPFFDEDPDVIVCREPAPGMRILCRVKLDENGEFSEVDTAEVKSMTYGD